MREKVELLLTGTEKGDVKITFDNVEKLDNYIETLITMRDDLAERIEIAKAKKREERKMRSVKNKLHEELNKQKAELEELYADFCKEYDMLSEEDKDIAKSYKVLIDTIYKFGKEAALNIENKTK